MLCIYVYTTCSHVPHNKNITHTMLNRLPKSTDSLQGLGTALVQAEPHKNARTDRLYCTESNPYPNNASVRQTQFARGHMHTL